MLETPTLLLVVPHDCTRTYYRYEISLQHYSIGVSDHATYILAYLLFVLPVG